jgi:hypothetical protein
LQITTCSTHEIDLLATSSLAFNSSLTLFKLEIDSWQADISEDRISFLLGLVLKCYELRTRQHKKY